MVQPDQATEMSIEYFAPHARATRSLQGCSDYVVLEQQLDDNIRLCSVSLPQHSVLAML